MAANPISFIFGKNAYEYFYDQVSFDVAIARSSERNYNGVTGHLVTITSLEENTAIYKAVGSNFNYSKYGENAAPWIAASDSAKEGDWRWVA
jgi:hypothetical protein